MAKGEFRTEIPKEKPEAPGLIFWVVLVVAIIIIGAGALVVRYATKPENPRQAASPGQSEALLTQTPVQARTQTPSRAAAETEASGPRVIIYRGKFGQFLARGWVNGEEIIFVVDTSASHVVLSPDDAERLGLRPAPEQYTVSARTAAGNIKAAPIRLTRVSLGPIHVENVDALINIVPMGYSLLGASYLDRLSQVDIQGSQMVLQQ
ncbi:MAG: hypothetical protein Tsb0016_05810 [Sphingomonadales bacterium]